MKVHNCEQGSEVWFGLRMGKMTASHATAIGTNGAGLNTYILELMADYYSSGERDSYSNKHMERGNELEDQAASIYELEIGGSTEKVGFIEHNDYSGCSPDRIVGKDGIAEIKCMDDKAHFKLILSGEQGIESKYIWQMQMQLLITKKKWCDFVAYNPNFRKSLLIFRVYKDEEKHKKLLEGLKTGEELIKKIKEQYEKI